MVNPGAPPRSIQCGIFYGYQAIHKNGYIKAEVAVAYALGAEGFNYWLWRQHRTGAEQTHGHIISSWGEPGIGFENIVEEGKLKKIREGTCKNRSCEG